MTSTTPKFTAAALANIAETGADWATDLAGLRAGTLTASALLEHCIDGADEDRVGGWREYVATLEASIA